MYLYEHGLQNPHWHWEITLYLFFAGVAVGSYIFAAFGQLWGSKSDQRHSITGYFFTMPLIALCGILVILDFTVSDKVRAFTRVLWNPRDLAFNFKPTSMMSMGAWAISVFGIFATISFLYAVIKKYQIESRVPFSKLIVGFHEGSVKKIYLTIGILLAGYIGSYTGILLTATQWPIWTHTSVIPLLFVISGVSTGLAVIVLAMTRQKREAEGYIHRLEKTDTYLMVAEIIVIGLFIFNLGPLAKVMITGSNGLLLFGGVLFAGLIVPLLLRYRPNLLGEKESFILSNALILIGGLILRYVMVVGAQNF
ncbi:MAG TPA: NrfD/PsrC family molybdoenzyme membrane anchor subunit [Bacillota bacterium]|nr:NrfD/PsrC family molybdoenzyme membrane anchor subunit [Bacillota bacterium]